MIKSGFKGKRANKKFGRYGKRGGNKKLNYTPLDHSTDDNSEHGFPQRICPMTTGRKVTKKQIVHRLSIVTSSCQEAQQQNQVTLSLNRSLIKKVSKSKEVVEGLRTCLKECRQEMRSTKSDLVKALQDNVSTKNTSLSREQEDQSLIAAIKKDAEATLEGVKRGHAIVTATIMSKSKLKMAAAETKHKRVVNIITQRHRSKMAATEMKHKRVVNIVTERKRATITEKENLHALELEEKNNKISVSSSFDIVTFLSSVTDNVFVSP